MSRADDLREALVALADECERGPAGLFPHGRVELDFTGKPFGSFVAVDRLRALLDAHPTPSEPEATVVEEWGVRWADDPEHIQRLSKERVDQKASRFFGDVIFRRTRTTYADRVTEWEEVDDQGS